MPAMPDQLAGFMLGTMIGDAIGLPFEGINRRRVCAMLGDGPLGHRLILRRWGMVSDDTEHMLMTVTAWGRAGGHAAVFERHLARRLRLWLIALPPATGFATARACFKLLVGVPPRRSGVRSAGNGPAMRAGVLGLLCHEEAALVDFVRAASRITHTDERAEQGALSIALAARTAASAGDRNAMIREHAAALERLLPDGPVRQAIDRARESVDREETTEQFARALDCGHGVSGFVMHTVPTVLHAWMSDPDDFRAGVTRIVRLGGDTDTSAALLGGLIGARVTAAGLPEDWLAGVRDFPVTPGLVRRAAAEAVSPTRGISPRWLVQPLRNAMFMLVVLAHAARRMLPPYG